MQRASAIASSSAGLRRFAARAESSQCLRFSRRHAQTAAASRQGSPGRFLYDPNRSYDQDTDDYAPLPVIERANFATPLGDLTIQLTRATRAGEIGNAFKICKQMRDMNIYPNAEIYNALLRMLHMYGQHEAMFAVFTDMEAAGVSPDIETYNLMLNSAKFNGLDVSVILDRMAAAGVERTALTYQHLISNHVEGDRLEMCLQLIDEMSAKGMQPTLQTVEEVTELASKLNFARLAVDLAVAYEEESIRRLAPVSWMKMLQSCAGEHYLEGTEICWTKGVIEGLSSPDEGLCIEILHVAARAGRPDLATDVLRVLRKIGVIFREHHLAPVLEAFMRAGNLKDALATLSLMRQNSIAPNERTTEPIFRHIVQSVDEVDKAFYILEDLKNDGKVIDVSALNVIIRACVKLNDLQRAVGTYKEGERLGVAATKDTYHYLLDACIQAKHGTLGEKLWEEMKNAGIKPDPAGLERMIMLSLTNTSYEEAFYYLEEMKTITPDVPPRVYEAIIRRCYISFDPRWKVAAEEVQNRGHMLSSSLLRFIERGHDEPIQQQQESSVEDGPANPTAPF